MIYNYVLELYKKKMNIVMTISTVFSYIITLLSATLLSVIMSIVNDNTNNYKWAFFGFSLASLIIGIVISILNSILKIYGWSNIILKYSLYIEKLESCHAKITNILLLPQRIRIDAKNFIKKQNKEYLKITRIAPKILSSEYLNAKHFFYQNSEMINYELEQKYNYTSTVNNLDNACIDV